MAKKYISNESKAKKAAFFKKEAARSCYSITILKVWGGSALSTVNKHKQGVKPETSNEKALARRIWQ